jgi:hypothetical protein
MLKLTGGKAENANWSPDAVFHLKRVASFHAARG